MCPRRLTSSAPRFGQTRSIRVLSADDLVCLLHQDNKDVHRPRSQWHDLCAIAEEPVADRQLKRTEAQNFPVLTAHGMFLIRAGSMTSLLYLVFPSPTGWTLPKDLHE